MQNSNETTETRRIEIDRAELKATIRRGNNSNGEYRICADDGEIFWSENGREDYGHADHTTFAVPATDPDGSGQFSEDFRDWIGSNGVTEMTDERRAELRDLVEVHGTYRTADDHLTPAEAADLEAGQDSYAGDLADELLWTLQGISDTPQYVWDRDEGERVWQPAPGVEYGWR